MQHELTLSAGPYTLRPLQEADIPALIALAQCHEEEYVWVAQSPVTSQFYTSILQSPNQMGFVKEVDGALAGCTRYLEMYLNQRRLEIGGTWLAAEFMRTPANRAFKLMLLQHAFEELELARVEIKTDLKNLRSQVAIERLGAIKEGVLRKHMVRRDGTMRDTVMYSITDEEWPAVKARLSSPRAS